MRRLLLCATACAVASGFALSMLAATSAKAAEQRRGWLHTGSRYLLEEIAGHQRATWRLQRLMSAPRTPSADTARSSRSVAYRRWVLALWRNRARAAARRAANPPRRGAWLCIHRHEGAWNDPHAPYYGGLQMDIHFQRTYGADLLRRKGTADNWTPLEQIWVAERAYRSGRGFGPWPNTARACNLF